MQVTDAAPSGAANPHATAGARARSEPEKTRGRLMPLVALACVGAFAMVVNVVYFGFSRGWADPLGYVVAILKPLALTLPGYLVVRIVARADDLDGELRAIGRALGHASLTVACYSPVIWFYLLTSPTPSFPLVAFGFGALAFWIPFSWDLARGAVARSRAWMALAWIALMALCEAQSLLGWLAGQLEGRMS